jgi:phospholipid transport system substrate-binding protein
MTSHTRGYNLRGILLTLVASASLLLPSVPSFAASAQPSVEAASRYVEALGNSAVETISSKTLDKETKRIKIEQLFRDNVDIDWVGRFVLGRFWRQITDEQKSHYLKEYEAFLIQHYATRFVDYTGGSFKITGARDDSDNEYTVSMQIKSSDDAGEPVMVDYRVRADGKKNKGGFVVFDIIVEGVSMITTQRSEFTSVVANKGMDYLITQLANKTYNPDAESH